MHLRKNGWTLMPAPYASNREAPGAGFARNYQPKLIKI